MSSVAKVHFEDYDSSVAKALDAIDAAAGLPQDGLVALWQAEGNARDSIGQNHGKIGAALTYTADRHGNPKGAFLFNDDSGFITVPDQDELDLTVDFRFKKGLLNGFWLRLRGAYLDQKGPEARDVTNIRVILNYDISIL